MKYTLLEIVQTVLSSMDSDEINSINDSVESQQVVEVVKTVYDDIISRGDLNSNKIPFNLDSSGDITKPVLMTKPSNIDRIAWLKYDSRKITDANAVWTDMQYVPFESFIDFTHSYNPAETNVETFTYVTSGFSFMFTYKTDTAPMYYTSFDDTTLIFDAYDSAVDTTLQAAKTMGYGFKATEFQKIDSYVPNLQPQQFALLLNEAKSLAWTELKQTQHPKAEQSARRNWRHLQKTRQQTPDGTVFHDNSSNFDKLPNFSRRPRF